MNRISFLMILVLAVACTDDIVYADGGDETGGTELTDRYECFAQDQSDGIMDWWLYSDEWAASTEGFTMPDLDPESDLTGIACTYYVATDPSVAAVVKQLPFWVDYNAGPTAPLWACSAACCSDRDCWGMQPSGANIPATCVRPDPNDDAGLCLFPSNADNDCPPEATCEADGFCDWDFDGT